MGGAARAPKNTTHACASFGHRRQNSWTCSQRTTAVHHSVIRNPVPWVTDSRISGEHPPNFTVLESAGNSQPQFRWIYVPQQELVGSKREEFATAGDA